MQAALESALAELALGPEIAESDARSIAAWLERHHVSEADARALTRDFPRLLVYRRLVRHSLREALQATIPRTLARLEASFEPYFAEFLLCLPVRTHSLRELTPQFLDFALERWARDPKIPAYLADLARHEALQVEIASHLARPSSHVVAELALDQGVELIAAVRLVHYAWAVHRLPEDETDRQWPEPSAVSLLIYRSPEHEVRYLELSPFARELLLGLIEQRLSLQAALKRAAERLASPLEDELLTRAAHLLSDLAERGVVLGKTAERPVTPADLLPKVSIPA